MKMHRVILFQLAALLLAGASPESAWGSGSPAAGIPRIDAHVHVAPAPDSFLEMLERLDIRLVNVTVVDPHAPGFDKTEPQTSLAIEASRRSRGRIGWIATFDPVGFEDPGFAQSVGYELQQSFEQGAVGVKIYKSIGMDLKFKEGRYLMPDDPVFAPVFQLIERENKTLMAHLAEPRSSWRPLDPADPHYNYYKNNPDWHMYLHPERPSWETIIAARDRMLEAHPKLRVVGCHLGSMEHDVGEIAKRLDRYPNFAVDTAARMVDLMLQPRDKVRDFMIRYQDRVLYGTDLMELEWADPQAVLNRWEATYDRDWRYFATAEEIQLGSRTIQGLALPEAVLRKIFHDNALRWLPGLQPPAQEIVTGYIQALGGEEALAKITSRGAKGSFYAPSYGTYGSYQEYSLAPGSLIRTFHVDGYGVSQRCVKGETGWTEDPEYGVKEVTGARLKELRLEAELSHPLSLRNRFSELDFVGLASIEGGEYYEVRGIYDDVIPVTLWFDPATRLLACMEYPETFPDGSSTRVRMHYEDYRRVDGVMVPHVLRFLGEDLIWVVQRGVAHNLELGEAPFRRPAN
jgi:predicted TIM-barrel fold metal-dependent hydrolase